MSVDSATSDIHADYEERARDVIRTSLFYCFNILVHQPEDGFNRKFSSTMFPAPWPLSPATEAQIDFFAHANDVKQIPSGPFAHPENHHITGVVSPCKIRDESESLTIPDSMSPERIDDSAISTAASTVPNPQGVKYIIGEITYGGRQSVLSKMKQLENGCKICLVKMASRSDIRNVVSVAVIVNPRNFVEDVFKELQNNNTKYPNLYQLFLAGRFIYINYTETHITMLRELAQVVIEQGTQFTQLQSQNDRLQSQNDRLQSQNDRLHCQVSETNLLVRELLTAVKGKSEES